MGARLFDAQPFVQPQSALSRQMTRWGPRPTITIGDPWKKTIATREVPAYRTAFVVATMSMKYPQMPKTHHPMINYTRFLNLSDVYAVPMTVRKAAILGGTAKSCAVVL